MDWTDHIIWREGEYSLFEANRAGLIKRIGEELENCLSDNRVLYGNQVATDRLRIFGVVRKTEFVAVYSLVRLESRLFIEDMRANKNHALNGTEPFYPAVMASIRALEELFDERILMPVYPDCRRAYRLMPLTARYPAFYHALLHDTCEGLQPNPYAYLWQRILDRDVSALIRELITADALPHLSADVRAKLVTQVMPFLSESSPMKIGAYMYEAAELAS